MLVLYTEILTTHQKHAIMKVMPKLPLALLKVLILTLLVLVTTKVIPKKSDPTITILFSGDFMFDRYIRQIAQGKGNDFILENVKPTLLNNDLVVVDLEGPITSFPSKSIYTEIGSAANYIFTFDPSVAQTLVDHNISLVSLGNNHILNFGQAGLEETYTILQEKGIRYFGNTGGLNGQQRWIVKEIAGVKLGFVNYNQFVENGDKTALEDILAAQKTADLIILYAHWGPEYTPNSVPAIQELAHLFIDAGVDLIIGSHPHVVQEKEVYQGKTIYYSLGNFVMDQYFSQATQEGLLVKVKIDKRNYSMEFEDISVTMDLSGQTKLKKEVI